MFFINNIVYEEHIFLTCARRYRATKDVLLRCRKEAEELTSIIILIIPITQQFTRCQNAVTTRAQLGNALWRGITTLTYLQLFHDEIGEVGRVVLVHDGARDSIPETLKKTATTNHASMVHLW